MLTLKRLPLIPKLSTLWLLILLLASTACPADTLKHISLPRTGLEPKDIAVIINDSDPLSRQIGNYYQSARNIPPVNIIRVRFQPGHSEITPDEFAILKASIDQKTPDYVQAFAVAWTAPYRVGCMSLTSALAFGFDQKYCADTCAPTALNPYFNSPGTKPYNDYRIRPAMMLAGTTFEHVKAMIDRGIRSDRTFPKGQAYLLSTSDTARNSRAPGFQLIKDEFSGVFPIQILETDHIADRDDVLFYFTGLIRIPMLDTLNFLPGAIADHLTSFGGMLTDSLQMSSLRWLEAGATASYGTVVEPCSFPQKFPAPAVAMFYYAAGASVIEAYWKSVAWPGQGVFIGEPLAKPFAPTLRETAPGRVELKVFSPRAGRLRMDKSTSAAGPFHPIARQAPIRRGENLLHINFDEKIDGYLRLQWN
ncbi:TIGR03790 family protein [Nitrosomonas sp. sh817]|uniref:TIGR03790 family protein n=1 Tax=Nitrosomonas sp. sh817 TaxID=3070658 RepID=UPI0027DE61CD|nr:TIGR03790 family protein [Nitrosomonas sp. sh817]WMJ07777.1 TIGR03790 family protein [Nitrosomonas sp. sh817]